MPEIAGNVRTWTNLDDGKRSEISWTAFIGRGSCCMWSGSYPLKPTMRGDYYDGHDC